MKQKSVLRYLLLPFIIMLALTMFLLYFGKGKYVQTLADTLVFLPQATQEIVPPSSEKADTWILYNAQMSVSQRAAVSTARILSEMAIPYQLLDVSTQLLNDFSSCTRLLLCMGDMTPLEERMEELIQWINAGGQYAQMLLPEDSSTFRMFYRQLGITEFMGLYENYESMEFVTDLLPGLSGRTLDDMGLDDAMIVVRLDESSKVHIRTGDDRKLPILWERDVENGRVVVLNCSLVLEKASSGLACAAISLLGDAVVYPIINSMMIYIDDFPGPQPEGYDEQLMNTYGYDIQGFFMNHWWPDMKQLVEKYGLLYTGVLIETYNDVQSQPFPEGTAKTLLRYYGAELLNTGGEIGWHGYNHQPLCMDGFQYAGEEYTTWAKRSDMMLAMQELQRFGVELFPEANYQTYVPPSNYLSEEGRKVLLETFPDLKAISGLYLSEDGVNAYVQEFCEEEDGIVSVPRIAAGYSADEYLEYVIAGELTYHGVFSHFIHPDDVLDDERGALLGWKQMYEDFEALISQKIATYPQLRIMTAASGAAAVQRYDRLGITMDEQVDKTVYTLNHFYDEAWLALRTHKPPQRVEGGTLYRIADGFYWIKASQKTVTLYRGR